MDDREFVSTTNKKILKCILCNKKITLDPGIRRTICLNCMAHLIKNLDIEPNNDYSDFLDFAYNAKDRIMKGENVVTIFNNIPDGFEDWVRKNSTKTGFGITLE